MGKGAEDAFFFSYWGTSVTALIYLLHVGSQFGVRWLVDLVPINGNFYLVIELKYDDGILQISRRQGCVLILLHSSRVVCICECGRYVRIQMINMWVHSQRVHPVPECPLFSCLL